MSALELSLVEMANRHYFEAKSWAETEEYSDTVVNMAKYLSMSEDQFVRHKWANAYIRCMAILELIEFDSGISEEASNKLKGIENLIVSALKSTYFPIYF